MKAKHIQVKSDRDLLNQLVHEVRNRLTIHPGKTTMHLALKFIFYFGVTVYAYHLLLSSEALIELLLTYILFGFSSLLFLFNFAHDLSHGTIFRGERLNHNLFVALYTLAGAHAEAWKHRHVTSHHHAPNVKDHDTDLQITSIIRVEPSAEHQWFHRYQAIYAPLTYMTYSLYWVFIKDFYVYFQDNRTTRLSTRYHLSFWLQKAAYLTYLFFIPMYVTELPFWMGLLSFLAMHLCISVFLLFTFFITHHVEKTHYFESDKEGWIQTSWINNQLKSSNDFHPFSFLANFIFGGFNNHIAHHLFPHIHHIHYPRLNKILYSILEEYGYKPNQTGFFGGIRSHLKHLKNLGRKHSEKEKM